MPRTPRLLAISGSLRRASLNTALLRYAADGCQAAGAEVTLIDLKDLDLPLYDGDLEEERGLPDGCLRLKDEMKSHDGLLLACPEYNSSITPALKNAIDWASRPREGEKPLECFAGKTAGLIACSPGTLGGLRGLVVVRMLLSSIRVHVLPQQYAAGTIGFDESGGPTSEAHRDGVSALAKSLVSFTAALHS